VASGRREIAEVFCGADDRLLAVVGPCSIHDTEAAIDYATEPKPVSERLRGKIWIAMRVYV
jgi:3-deoxy-7-phosphoheptulonate synthase